MKKLTFVFLVSAAALALFFFSVPYADAAVISRPPPNLGLVGYWSFNEGTSTRAGDFSGNGNMGVLTNMPANPWVNGKQGKALDFDGSNDYVNTPALNITTNIATFTAWIYSQSTQIDFSGIVYSRDSTQPVGIGYGGTFGANVGKLSYTWNNGNQNTWGWNSGLSIPQNQWTFVAVAIDASKAIAYMCTASGCQNATNAISHSSQLLDTRMLIGWDENQSIRVFNGLIDEVRIYNRALSAKEVESLFKSGQVAHKNPSNLGLVGYWSFNEGTSTTVGDSSGNGNNGTTTNMGVSPAWRDGKLGKALEFDGSNDYVDVGLLATTSINNLNGATALTFSAWVKPSLLPPGAGLFPGIFGRGTTNQRTPWLFSNGGASTLTFQFETTTGGANDASITTGTFSVGVWQHVAFTWNGSTVRYYYNGVAGVTDSTTGSILANTDGNAFIGLISSFHNWKGGIDEVRIYNRALSGAEVKALYGSGAETLRRPSDNGLVGYWSFNEGTSTQAGDFSGNGNTGILTNMEQSDWVPGKQGKALEFDGGNDFVDMKDPSSLFAPNDLTFSLWFKIRRNVSDSGNYLLSDYNAAGTRSTISARIANGNIFRWFYENAAGPFQQIDGTSSVNLNTWYHLAGVLRGTTQEIYVNGVRENSGTVSGTRTDHGGNFTVGRAGSFDGAYFDGLIDEVRIYNRALPAAEVKQLYNLGR